MFKFKNSFFLGLVLAAVFCVSGGSAREPDDEESDTEADMVIRMRRQHLDTYWQDTSMWAQYGYRPHVKAHYHQFMNFPSYSAGSRYGYSYGTVQDLPTVDLSVLDRRGKNDIQMNKYGVWH